METRHEHEKNPFSKKTQALIARIQALLASQAQGEAPEAALTAPSPPSLASTPSPPPPPPSWPPQPARTPLKEEVATQTPAIARHSDLLAQVKEALGRYPEALEGLSPTARRAYALLLALGLELLTRTLGGRPLPRSLGQVTAFAVNRILAHALGVSEATLYRALAELEEASLIRRRPWRTPATIHGRTGMYAAGAVYAVRLPHRDRRPRLEREDFAHPWRDLDGDIQRRRTAFRAVRECKDNPPKGDYEAFQLLLRWALSPVSEAEYPLDLHSLTGALRGAKGREKRLLVAKIALGLAQKWRDPGSIRAYAWVIWGALRAELYGAHDRALEVVMWAISRVQEAILTGSRISPRRPGALFLHLLKQQGLLGIIRALPPWRVA
ncbi:MAG: hypothetical protein ACK4ZX_03445 [Thermus sp.]